VDEDEHGQIAITRHQCVVIGLKGHFVSEGGHVLIEKSCFVKPLTVS
jgi:hypothetical protein